MENLQKRLYNLLIEGSLGKKRGDRLFKAAQKLSRKGEVMKALPLYRQSSKSIPKTLHRIKRDKKLD